MTSCSRLFVSSRMSLTLQLIMLYWYGTCREKPALTEVGRHMVQPRSKALDVSGKAKDMIEMHCSTEMRMI